MKFGAIVIAALGLGNAVAAQDLLTVLAGIKEARDFFNRINNDPILKPILQTVRNVTIVAPVNAALNAIKNQEVVIHKDKGGGQTKPPPGQTKDILARTQVLYHVLDGIFPQSAFTKTPKFIPTKIASQGVGAANGTGSQPIAGIDQSFLPNHTVPENVTLGKVEGPQVVKGDKSGKTVRFTGGLNQVAKVTKGDIKFDGGVIHVIDKVLPTPQTVTDTLRAANLTQLLGAIKQTGLQDLFNFLPNITIFAPRNESFNKISSVINGLVNQQRQVKGTVKQIDTELASLLKYTVGHGVFYSTFLNNLTISSLNNDQVLLSTLIKGSGFVNHAKAVSTDLLVNNGVIHVIDNVLNPDNVTAPSANSSKSGSVMFANATKGQADLNQGDINNKPIPLPAATPITPVPRPGNNTGVVPVGSPTPTPVPTPNGGGGGAGPNGAVGGAAGGGPSRAKDTANPGTKTQSQTASKTSSSTGGATTGPYQTNNAAPANEAQGTVAALVGLGAMLMGM